MKQRNRSRHNRMIHVMAMSLLIIALLTSTATAAGAVSDEAKKQEIVDIIVRHHVSGIEREDLDLSTIDAIIGSLQDPYSEYLSVADWQKFMDMLENNYTGIGIRVGLNESGFFVNEVFPDTPAKEAGMLDGDYIVGVNGESVTALTTDELIAKITGVEGTEVQITVDRDGKHISLTMKRRAIHIPALTSGLFSPNIGYVRITSFSSDADELFSKTVDDLVEKGMQTLVLDLRDNPGGLLDTAGNIAKRLIDKGNLIHTKDRSKTESAYPIIGENTIKVPITVLVNEFSASASEVLAGALQDYEIAKLIGKKTFGKGSVQSLYELSDGSVLKLTVQEYLTPNKHPVNNVGLTPDVEVSGDVPQLITALQRAGDVDVVAQLSNRGMKVNGIPVTDYFHVVRENGMTYVPSRVLAALVDSEISWNAKTKAVLIKQASGQTSEFLVQSEGVKLDNGVSYIALNRFETQFEGFAWEDKSGTLTLYENGRN